jgi:hypothetical protein
MATDSAHRSVRLERIENRELGTPIATRIE